MSLVGPRPERPELIHKFRKTSPATWPVTASRRHHRMGAGSRLARQHVVAQRVQYDLYYITHWTPWLDLRLLVMTVFKGIVNRNAY